MIKTTNHYGIVIKKASLTEKSLSKEDLCRAMEAQPLDESSDLLSFGPNFGEEAAEALSKRLEAAGLAYVDDFFIFQGDYPDWVSFGVELV